jgi:hypothetical protein
LEWKFGPAIDRFVAFKISAFGGRGNEELEASSKREWKDILQKTFKPWIGHLPIGTDKKILLKTIIDNLNKSIVTRGKTKGQPLSQQRKKNVSKKIS